MKYIYLTVLLLSVSFLSCKKGCTDPSAINYDSKLRRDDGSCSYPDATLSISLPTSNHAYSLGDTVVISAMAHHYQDLQGWDLTLLNKTTGNNVYTLSSTDVGKDLTINGNWTNNVSDTSEMELTIVLKVNSSGKTLTQSVDFSCLP